jgi:deazaflavin-dependent oxidoreductase (nitroreductase family)
MTFPRALSRYTRGAVNKMTLRFAGHAAFADLEHVGRRSGLPRHTPVRAFRSGDNVVVGLNFGRESDWLKSIKAAGTCRMHLGATHLRLGTPTVVPLEQGIKAMPWLFRVALRHVVHTAECVELPILEKRRVQSGRPPRPTRPLAALVRSRHGNRCRRLGDGAVLFATAPPRAAWSRVTPSRSSRHWRRSVCSAVSGWDRWSSGPDWVASCEARWFAPVLAWQTTGSRGA